MQQEITSYLVQLAQRPLTAEQSAAIPVLTRCTNDAERLAEYAGQMMLEAARFTERCEKLSKKSGERAAGTLPRGWGAWRITFSKRSSRERREAVPLVRALSREICGRADRLEAGCLDNLRRGHVQRRKRQ